MNEIRFYRTEESFGLLSNCSRYSVCLDSFVWPTVEHYYQANKFTDYKLQDKIRLMHSPMDAIKEGRDFNNPIRTDWDLVKIEVMRKALTYKFMQHHKLRRYLLETGEAKVIGIIGNDSFWGIGGNGDGENKFGYLLMQIREEIRSISDDPKLILPPWLAFPGVDEEDMFWRMGFGENYLYEWWKYCSSINIKSYKLKFPSEGYRLNDPYDE